VKVYYIEEHGYERAMRGLARSFNQPIEKMPGVALGLANKDRGHNKFLRFMVIYCEIEASRDWWSQFDTYKIGTVAQSDSTMHTLLKQPLTQDNFEEPIPRLYLWWLNWLIKRKVKVGLVKKMLPEGFLQGRSVMLNYATLREIIIQRRGHNLPEWSLFCVAMVNGINHPELLGLKKEDA